MLTEGKQLILGCSTDVELRWGLASVLRASQVTSAKPVAHKEAAPYCHQADSS